MISLSEADFEMLLRLALSDEITQKEHDRVRALEKYRGSYGWNDVDQEKANGKGS